MTLSEIENLPCPFCEKMPEVRPEDEEEDLVVCTNQNCWFCDDEYQVTPPESKQ